MGSTCTTSAISSRPTRSARSGRWSSTPRTAAEAPSTCTWPSRSIPRTLLSFEDAVFGLPEDEEPPDEFHFPLTFTWALPPLPNGPDLLRLAIDLAGVGGIELPLEVSAIDSYASATDAAERRLNIVARSPVSLARILAGEEMMCEVFDRCLAVSRYLLDSAGSWLG